MVPAIDTLISDIAAQPTAQGRAEMMVEGIQYQLQKAIEVMRGVGVDDMRLAPVNVLATDLKSKCQELVSALTGERSNG